MQYNYINGYPWRNQFQFNNLQSGELTWDTEANLPFTMASFSAVIKNKVYLFGGDVGTSTADVKMAAINSDGTLGTWGAGPSLPSALDGTTPLLTSSRIYLIGGIVNGTTVATVYSAMVNSDGTLGAWVTDTKLPGPLRTFGLVVTKNRVYLCGGSNGSASTTVYTALINADGTLGIWTVGTSIPGPYEVSNCIVTKTRVYLCGGWNGSSTLNTTYTAPINYDGTLGPWTTGTSLPVAVRSCSVITTATTVYLLGGYTGVYVSTVYKAPINSDGTLGTWVTSTSSLPGIMISPAIITSSKIYLLGGNNGTLTAQVYSANFSGGSNDYTNNILTPIWDVSKKLNIKILPQSENLSNFPMLLNLSNKSGLLAQDCTRIFKELSPISTNDPYASNVVLAMPMEGNNNSIIFKDYCGKTVTVNGNARISTTQFKFGASSAYFDGAGAYLSLATTTDFDFGTGDFTVESWFYIQETSTTNSSAYAYIITAGYPVSGSYSNCWALTIDTSALSPIGAISFEVYSGTTWYGTQVTVYISKQIWHHIAICRQSGSMSVFLDGTKLTITTNTITGAISITRSSGNIISIGGSQSINTYRILNGYIDDLRVTKGVARYTSSFTPPLASLITIITDPPTFIDDPNWGSVVLAMPMKGSNGSTTLIDLKENTVSNNAVILSTTQYKFNQSSCYLNGSAFLAIPNSSAWDFIASDFTIECFIYQTARSGHGSIATRWNTTGNASWRLLILNTGQFNFSWVNADNTDDGLSTVSTLNLNTWYHICISRYLNTVYLFIDGILSSSKVITQTIKTSTSSLNIGRNEESNTWYFTGYIDDFQIIKGRAKYTTNFTPPTSSVIKPPNIALPISDDPYWDKVVLALPMDGTNNSTTFKDLRGKAITVVGDAKILTTQSKFGGSSAYFDGTDDYLSLSNSSDWNIGTGDFCIELSVYLSANSAANNDSNRHATLVSCLVGGSTFNTGWEFFVSGNSLATGTGVRFYGYTSSVTTVSALATYAFSLSSWYNITLTRYSGVLVIFVNGISIYSATHTGNIDTSGCSIFVGGSSLTGYKHCLAGYIDNLRITKGEARYTSNFTPSNVSFHHTGITTPKKFIIEDNNSGQCFVEIERWDALQRSAQLWVNVPVISNSSATLLTMYYNSAAEDNTFSQEMWEGVAVALPMQGSPGSNSFIDLKNNSISVGGNVSLSTVSKFGGTSAYFDGSGDRLSFTYSLSGSSDFTIELYVYLINGGHGNIYSRILHIGSGNNLGAFNIVCDYNQNPAPIFASIWTPSEVWIGGTPLLNNNQWYHIAVCRKNNVWYMFYDGIKCSSDVNNSMNLSQNGWSFGTNAAGNSESFYGHMSDIRVTKGFARYTAPFTPPTRSYLKNALGYIGDIGSYPAKQVWEKDYVAIYHLSQDPSTTVKDSTINTRNLTTYGSMTTAQLVDGPTGKATNFDGIDDYLAAPVSNLSTLQTAFTIETIAKFTAPKSTAFSHLVEIGDFGAGALYLGRYSTTDYLNTAVAGDDLLSNINIDINNYKSYGLLLSSGTVKSIGNGIIDTISNTVSVQSLTSSPIYITKASSAWYQNTIRSIRISQSARTPGWLEVSYKSDFDQLSALSFLTLVVNDPYPSSYIKTYGLQQQLQLTASFSTSIDNLTYDTTFYKQPSEVLATVSNTLNNTPATFLLPTTSGTDYFWYAIISVPSQLFNYTTPVYSFYTRYLCSGICETISTPASGIVVNLHRRSNGQLVASTTTAGTGTFMIDSTYSDLHYIIALNPDVSKNALIFDKILPV